MRCAFLAATAFFAIAVTGQQALAADPPYIDDRSDAAAVIRSLYSAINRHEFARAWGYYGDTKPAKDFDAFVKGYDGTDTVEVKTGAVSDEGAAGSIYHNVPVAIQATDKKGEAKVFAGCYTLRQVNGQIQEPPFQPIVIDKGALKPSTADFEEAVPASCGDGPPPPKKDEALEQAKQAFAATYAGQCDKELFEQEPELFSIKYKDKSAAEGDPERETRLFHFACSAAAYNESSIYYIYDDVSGVRQLQFAEPEMDIRYANNDSDGKVESMHVVGFQATGWAVNSAYDDATKTITTFNKWRGVGDASSSGTYLFRNGDFSLVQYDVDASYDGEQNPQAVVDYNTAP
ncbi:DUF1176 domain-containing protein [Mesorhizobium sp. M4B.F.Ca.ET.215.01.1.1]|uniref:DUF1176 domain-containing protein n=1 Tax=unclassified Mesorhizobium TaxID=325217 RepID=UPI000FCB3CEE|nr:MULTISPECIES: DUF1176 domain-containing protein [unclassified Mesorhizobium]RUW20285.1 DUF1176 domain-containing protein [Mesorhizobium sp. M4B.F.Ca.ET.013.02.1.1]RVD45816.1 DUF1176 domain-containing protein [Mesorhizobium sp. M4B.F.Ca.ET.019.03.1.1]TGQ08115.1 DUF1176 domain-containing protein [Mesorhizobium sp. M4B.F.Ca.ET.215.01.1.1]TGQ35907.1 DUF1176 domain-containing protein [Mesorhizobium sp. M00.F.Ca.ET.220.01.1.1]TGR01477.1 DUF1176 domain-containing protein [Mesorhizobium sp. M4B.F.C